MYRNLLTFKCHTATDGCYDSLPEGSKLLRYTNVVRREAVFYLRVAVPVGLRAVVGKNEIWKSLRTTSEREARKLAAIKLADFESQWEELKVRLESRQGSGSCLTDMLVNEIVAEFYRSEAAADEHLRQRLPSSEEIDAARFKANELARARDLRGLDSKARQLALLDLEIDYLAVAHAAEHYIDQRRALLSELRKHSAVGETALIAWAVYDAINRHNLSIDRGSPDFKRLAAILTRAWIEVLDRAAERDKGDWSGTPRDPKIAEAFSRATDSAGVTNSNRNSEVGETVGELFERYAAENPGNVKPDTIEQSRKIIGLFVESLPGPRFPASRISKKEVREWKALLQHYPVKAAEIKVFKEKLIAQIVDMNKSVGKPTLSQRSVNKYLSALGAFCSWLVNHGYIENNPVEGLFVKHDRDVTRVFPYNVEQLNTIFASPLYSGCRSEKDWSRAGQVSLGDHFYWLPLLALFTGARLAELAQLRVGDIKAVQGHWAIHITREGGNTTKTKGSQRVVPVHHKLLALDFSAFVNAVRLKGSRFLFPMIGTNTRGQIAGDYSRTYGRFIERIGLKRGRALNFHSYRHTFTDALRRAGLRDEQFNFLLGHTQSTTTGRYGIITEGLLEDRAKLVAAVSFEGLVLPPAWRDT